MGATNFTSRSKLATFSILLVSSKLHAEMMSKGETKVKTLLNIYSQDSNSGKQVFDNSGNENVFVVEPQIFIKHQITEDTEINSNFVLDAWSAKSDTILDSMTGASGAGKTNQSRIAGTFGARKEIDKTTHSASLGFSSEYDYKSINLSAGSERSFAEDNFTLAGGIQIYKDQVDLFENLSTPQTAQITTGFKRDIYAFNLSASQILTRRDIALLTLTRVNASGRLESTAGTVNVNGTRTVEKLPRSRQRNAISTKWVHAFSEETAINLSHRYYFDNWNLSANTTRLAYLISLNDDQDFLEFAFRYHTQNAVDYYKDRFAVSENFMTSDSDMSKFHSYSPSITYSKYLGDKEFYGFKIIDCEWTNSLTYSKRNTGLQSAYFQTGFAFKF